MKKKAIACFAVMIAVLFAAYLIVLAKTDRNIPLLKGISFEDSADTISSQFGEPIAIVPNKYDMGMTFYEYDLSLLNVDANVEFAFSEGGLEQAYIYWSLSTEEEATEMLRLANQEIADAFWWRIDFKQYAPEVHSGYDGETYKQTLSKLNTIKQVHYSVKQEGTEVFVRCLGYAGSSTK